MLKKIEQLLVKMGLRHESAGEHFVSTVKNHFNGLFSKFSGGYKATDSFFAYHLTEAWNAFKSLLPIKIITAVGFGIYKAVKWIFSAPYYATSILPTSDYFAYLNRVKTQLLRYRLLSFGLILMLVVGLGTPKVRGQFSKPYIARIKIHGRSESPSLNESVMEESLKKLAEDKKVLGVIIDINSPGGSVAGTEIVYKALLRLGTKKPTVAMVGEMAASGGYLLALACNEIYAYENSVIGSIGVIAINHNAAELAKKIGITTEFFRTSDLKATPNPFEDTSPQAREAFQRSLFEAFDWFKLQVKKRRNLTDAEVDAIATADVFLGNTALKYKMIDGIATSTEFIESLKQQNLVPHDIKIVDVMITPPEPKKTSLNLMASLVNMALNGGKLLEDDRPRSALNFEYRPR